MVVNYSSVEITGNYNLNIKENIIKLTLGTRGKNFSRRHFEIYFSFFFSVLDNAYFLEKSGNYHHFVICWIFVESGNGKRQTLFMLVWKMGLIPKDIKDGF